MSVSATERNPVRLQRLIVGVGVVLMLAKFTARQGEIARQLAALDGKACDAYLAGLDRLALPRDRIPQLGEINAALTARADALLKENSYAPGEPDRVVLFVSLKAERDGRAVFDQTWAMDAWGDAKGTAMARLVSTPVSFAVESLLAGDIAAGVHPAPHDPKLIAKFLGQVTHLAQYMTRVDHLA